MISPDLSHQLLDICRFGLVDDSIQLLNDLFAGRVRKIVLQLLAVLFCSKSNSENFGRHNGSCNGKRSAIVETSR